MVVERVPPTRDGKRIRKWVPTLLEAAKMLEGETAVAAPTVDLGPTLKEFSIDFLARHEPARKDPLTYGSNVRILLGGLGESIHLGEITVPMLLDFRVKRIKEDGVKDYSVNRQTACLSAIFEAAKRWDVWDGPNPCRKVDPFPEPPPRDRVYSEEEVGRILGAATSDPPFYAMVVTALFTGLRKGSLRSLEWEDVRDGFVVVKMANVKGRRGHRVPLHPDLKVILDALPRQGRFVFHRDGKPFTKDMVRAAWDRVRKAAKVVDARGSRFHDLRRTFGTEADERGVGMGLIQRLMGHQHAATTERYLHVRDRALQGIVDRLGPRLPGTPPDSRGQGQPDESDPVSTGSRGENPKR
jgi:integrase